MERETGKFFIGEEIDPSSGDRSGPGVTLKSSDFTTHGVIVGMTGSGKTGLGVVLLEEALSSGIPVLAIDPKGDLGNLCLTFPNLEPSDFEPWVDKSSADSAEELAAQTADTWKKGLADWDIAAADIEQLKSVTPTIYTPGSETGVPLDVLGRLQAPSATDEATIQNEVENTVTALLNLIGVESDPLSGREHILLSNLVSLSWSQGKDLDLPSLLVQIQKPPMRKLGVMEIDTFFPEKDRQALSMKLNGLIASPSFAPWAKGAPLDIEKMLWNEQGDPQAAIVSLSHLEESERQFAVTLLLSKVISWMRSQQGTGNLRALIYIDEVMGYAPPNSKPPTKKPILTILKQARAFGVGLVLSTQNPVDLDYKALSNAGTWLVGRLQTEQDKNRLIDGLRAADGSTDITELSNIISGLGKRQFVLRSTKTSTTPVFTTRWAMSYLAGPLSREQITLLMADNLIKQSASARAAQLATTEAATAEQAEAPTDGWSPVPPEVTDTLQVRYADAAAPWLANIGAAPHGKNLFPLLAARVQMLFDDTKADLRELQEWEALIPLGEDAFDLDQAHLVDFDDRDFVTSAPEGAQYKLPAFEIKAASVKKVTAALKTELYTSQTIKIYKNKELKLWSRPDESSEDFTERCATAAEDKADEEAAKLRDKITTKAERVQAALAKAEDRLSELEIQEDGNKKHQLLDVGSSILGSLLGGRKKSRGLASAARRMSNTRKRSASTKARADTAHNRVEEKKDELEELEIELQDSVIEIDQKWADKANLIEEIDVPLEKTDITVKDLMLVWIPQE